MNLKSAWSRRSFLSTFSIAVGGLWSARNAQAAGLMTGGPYTAPPGGGASAISSGLGFSGDIYAELGVVPVINGAGTYTVLGGSLMYPEVIEAMRLGNEKFVPINDLEVAAGKKMAELCKMPEGYTGLEPQGQLRRCWLVMRQSSLATIRNTSSRYPTSPACRRASHHSEKPPLSFRSPGSANGSQTG